MAKYGLTALVGVSAYTEVEADSFEEAKEIAEGRECMLGFNGCGYTSDEVWLIEDADGMPTDITGEEIG